MKIHKKDIALLLALLLGGLGAHRFYYKQYYWGAAYLLFGILERLLFLASGNAYGIGIMTAIGWFDAVIIMFMSMDRLFELKFKSQKGEMSSQEEKTGRVKQRGITQKIVLFEFITQKIDKLDRTRLARHTVFWSIGYLIYVTIVSLVLGDLMHHSVLSICFCTVAYGFIIYICLYNNYLLDRFVFNSVVRRYPAYLLSILIFPLIPLALIIFSSLAALISITTQGVLLFILLILGIPLTYMILSGLLKAIFTITRERKDALEKEKAKLDSELKFLKSQLNPHFLLNTINNIYGLALTNSKKTHRAIFQLSELLKYLLESTKNDSLVYLKKELHFIKTYISLEKLRLGSKGTINLKIRGQVKQHEVIPLLFVTFIENSIKHGLNTLSEGGFINILFDLGPNNIRFQIENNFDSRNTSDESLKIGLTNICRQLELKYPNRHQLTIQTENEKYSVTLDLAVDDN